MVGQIPGLNPPLFNFSCPALTLSGKGAVMQFQAHGCPAASSVVTSVLFCDENILVREFFEESLGLVEVGG
jgi:hypothetical protein